MNGCKLLIQMDIFGGAGGIGPTPPSKKRSASLSQSATRFHLGKIWATKFVFRGSIVVK